MAEVRRAREVLEAERRSVINALRRARAQELRAAKREAERREAARRKVADLLARGRDAGVPVVEMADAYGVTRQMAHRVLREREQGEQADA
jgi:hypothetical protein